MRLGELRTATRDVDNKLIVKVSEYDTEKGVIIFDTEIDIITDKGLYLRKVSEDVKYNKDYVLLENDILKRFRWCANCSNNMIYDNYEERVLYHDIHDMDFVMNMLNNLNLKVVHLEKENRPQGSG